MNCTNNCHWLCGGCVMNVRFLFVTFFLLLFLSTAFADLNCPSTPFSKIYAIANMLEDSVARPVDFKKITCHDVEPVSLMVENIDDFIRGYLEVPTVGIHLISKSEKIYYADILTLTTSLLIDGYAKNPIYTSYAWAHEYGHAIFQKNLERWEYDGKVWIMLGKFTADIIQMELSMMKIQVQLEICYAKRAKLDSDSSERSKLNEEISSLEKDLDSVLESSDHLAGDEIIETIKLRKAIADPYNELFADLVGVLYSFKGDAISDTLNRTRAWTENDLGFRDGVIGRDFTSKKNRLDNWKVKKMIHVLFAPVRYHLWEKYLEKHLRKDKEKSFRGKMLGGVFAAIKKELEKIYPRIIKLNPDYPEMTYQYFSDTEILRLNSELIKSIDFEIGNIR